MWVEISFRVQHMCSNPIPAARGRRSRRSRRATALLAIVSSFRDRPCPQNLLSFGELGLAGEVRPVRFGAERIAQAAKQGFKKAIVPQANVPKITPQGIEIIGVRNLSEALTHAFD